MERKLTTAEFIEQLQKAEQTLQRAHEWEQLQASREQQRGALTETIAALKAQEIKLRASVDSTLIEVNAVLHHQRIVADQELDIYRAKLEEQKQEMKRSFELAKQTAQDLAAKAHAEAITAATDAAAARHDLQLVQEALAKSYADIDSLSKRVAGR